MEAPSASPVAVQPQTPPPVDDLPEAALKAAAQANTSTDAQAATADLTTDSNSATATTTTADVPIAEDWHVPEAVTETGGYEDDVEDQVEDQDEDVGTTEQPGASAPTTEQQGAEQEQEQEQEEQEPKPSAPEPHEPPEKRPHVTPPTPPPEREAPLKLAQLMPACWHRPFLSLNVDGALAARVPEDGKALCEEAQQTTWSRTRCSQHGSERRNDRETRRQTAGLDETVYRVEGQAWEQRDALTVRKC